MKYFRLFAFLAVALADDMELKPLCEVISKEYKVVCENTSKLTSKYYPTWKECSKKCKFDTKCTKNCPKFYDKMYKESEAVKTLECANKCEKDTICASKCPNIILTFAQYQGASNCVFKCNQKLDCITKCAGNLLSPDLNKNTISLSGVTSSTGSATLIIASGTKSITSTVAGNTGSVLSVASRNDIQNSKSNSSTSTIKIYNTLGLISSLCLAFIFHLFVC